MYGQAPTGVGVRGDTSDNYGQAVTGTGVRGDTFNNYGVYGQARTGTGVHGDTFNNYGVHGQALRDGGIGVRGDAVDFYGVYGYTETGVGVRGHCPGLGGTGVHGTGRSGVLGQSDYAGGMGVIGRADAPLGRGVRGFSDTGVAVSGVTRTGWAGEFLGDVIVRGRHIVTGRKSAAVQHPDGSTRLLFCMEGPQPRFRRRWARPARGGPGSGRARPRFRTAGSAH
jgi:hypothetical protein